MSEAAKRRSVKAYFSHACVATLLVLGAPLLMVMWLQASGLLTSTMSSIMVGVLLSFGTGSLGSALWMRSSRSSDLVFGDLMLWGWLRRYFLEKQITKSAMVLEGVGDGSSGGTLSLARQSRILHKLASNLESADPYTHGHSRRVARHAYMIAKRMGLSGGESALIRTAAALHDVGKLRVPVYIIHKPGRLTEAEFTEIKKHPVVGAEMVSILGNERLTAIIRNHHERLDGRGYPDRLSGDQIPMGARIIAVADTFDAITSSRPYRAASRHKKAIEIIRNEAGTQLDPHAVEAFLHYYGGRRSITLWALLTSAPHRALDAISGLVQRTASAGISNVVGASTAALIVGSSVFVAGAGLQSTVDGARGNSSPHSSTEVRNDVVEANQKRPSVAKEDRGARVEEPDRKPLKGKNASAYALDTEDLAGSDSPDQGSGLSDGSGSSEGSTDGTTENDGPGPSGDQGEDDDGVEGNGDGHQDDDEGDGNSGGGDDESGGPGDDDPGSHDDDDEDDHGDDDDDDDHGDDDEDDQSDDDDQDDDDQDDD